MASKARKVTVFKRTFTLTCENGGTSYQMSGEAFQISLQASE